MHAGGCHCGAVRFEVEAPAELEVEDRNCSIPFYVPRSHPDGYSVNARCLDPGSVTRLEVRPFDGQNWERSIETLRG